MRYLSNSLIGAALATFAFAACTPKAPVVDTSTPSTSNEAIKPPAGVELSTCPKFSDAKNPGQVEDNYVIYRDFLRVGEIQKAYELWQKVYAVAPAADGQRNTVITDGIYFSKYFASQTADPVEQAKYRDEVFAYYDQIDECYPTERSMVGRKAFDYFYTYPGVITKAEDYALFKQAISEDGLEVGDYIINPLSSLVVDLHEEGTIDDAEAKSTVKFLTERLSLATAEAKSKEDKDRMDIINGYAPYRLAYFEGIEGFYDCEYYKQRYADELEDAKGDYVRLSQLAGYLRFGGCEASDPMLAEIVTAANKVRPVEVAATRGSGPFDELRDGNYRKAIGMFEERYESATDSEKKAQYALVIAKVYYGNLREFSNSRSWARKAAAAKSGWGEPYILIGKLYASSGPLCGSGTGFESQRVVWPAIDQWQKAKSVDGSVSGEANRLIGRYSAYMPVKDDLFMNGMKEGQSYTVDCWINETTRVRGK